MPNSLSNFLKSVNKETLAEIKKKASDGTLADLLQNVDSEKAEKLIAQLGLTNQVKNLDLNQLIENAKNNQKIAEEMLGEDATLSVTIRNQLSQLVK